MDIIFTIINLAAAGATLFIAAKVFLQVHTHDDRLSSIEHRCQSLQGKIGAVERWGRDEIRDAVDIYLETSGANDRKGSDMESLLQMAMLMSGNRPQPAEPEGDAEPSWLLGGNKSTVDDVNRR